MTSGSHRNEKSDIFKGFVKLVVNHLNIIEVKNIKKQEVRSQKYIIIANKNVNDIPNPGFVFGVLFCPAVENTKGEVKL